MFYERNHSGFGDPLQIDVMHGIRFPRHIHRNYELIIARNAGMVMEIDGKTHTLDAGMAAFIFPHQCHAYRAEPSNISVLYIFSPDLIPSFHQKVHACLPENPVFRADTAFLRAFSALTDPEDADFGTKRSPFLIKSFLYGFGDRLLRNTALIKKEKNAQESLLERILALVDEDLTENGSLSVIAEKLNYDYTYLSKYFVRMAGLSFSRYINECRIHKACQMVSDTAARQSMTEIAAEVGYSSIRSFNDNFKKIIGVSPSEYQKNAAKNE